MIRPPWSLVLSFAGVAALWNCSTAIAFSPGPQQSYIVVCPGGTHVFAMISRESVAEELRHWNEPTATEVREVRRVYKRSGMYKTDDPTTPLWTIDWYAHSSEIAVLPDAVHLVRYTSGIFSGVSLTFFANGKELRNYSATDLGADPNPSRKELSHKLIYNLGADSNNSHGIWWEVTRDDGARFVFDVRTGEQVSKTSPPVGSWWIVAVVFGGVILGGLTWLGVRWWQRCGLSSRRTSAGLEDQAVSTAIDEGRRGGTSRVFGAGP